MGGRKNTPKLGRVPKLKGSAENTVFGRPTCRTESIRMLLARLARAAPALTRLRPVLGRVAAPVLAASFAKGARNFAKVLRNLQGEGAKFRNEISPFSNETLVQA